jgi:hypothetical protein
MKLPQSIFKGGDQAVTIGLGEAAVVYMIYSHALPSHTDIRSADPHNTDVEAARKRAAWHSGLFVALLFLIHRDKDATLIAAAALTGIDLTIKHANAVSPSTGRMANRGTGMVDLETALAMTPYVDSSELDVSYDGAY